MIRKGLGKGLGMGYKNIAPLDSHIHSLSAKGVRTVSLNMMGLATIKKLNQEAGDRAKGLDLQPYIVNDTTTVQDIRLMPNFGDYRPKGWELVETYFVDSSGFGQEGEPALTLRQFMGRIKKGRGYAIIEAGQFQVYIGEFEKKSSKDVKSRRTSTLNYKTMRRESPLKNVNRLEILQSITVPSTEYDKKIPKEKYMKRIDEVQKWLSKTFGGETTIKGVGGYVANSGNLIEENVSVVTSFADDKNFEEKQRKLVEQIKRWKDDWKQESIAYQVEDDLYLIGGNIK